MVTGLTTHRRNCIIFFFDNAVTLLELGPLIAILFSAVKVFYFEFIFLGVSTTRQTPACRDAGIIRLHSERTGISDSRGDRQ